MDLQYLKLHPELAKDLILQVRAIDLINFADTLLEDYRLDFNRKVGYTGHTVPPIPAILCHVKQM